MCILSDVIIPSLWGRLEGWLITTLAKYGFNWLKKKARNWVNKELQSKLTIEGTRFYLEEVSDDLAFLYLNLRLISKLSTKLCPEEITLAIEVAKYPISTSWKRKELELSKHIINDIDGYKDLWWGFYIKVPLMQLKKYASKKWSAKLNVIFQNQYTKMFENISFKLRTSDVEQVKHMSE